MIPPDPRNWWDLWWNHLIPQLSTISHQWQYIGGKLWNQRNSIEEHPTTACPALYLLIGAISCVVSTILKSLRVMPHVLILQDGCASLERLRRPISYQSTPFCS
jgi:hypothetical protein